VHYMCNSNSSSNDGSNRCGTGSSSSSRRRTIPWMRRGSEVLKSSWCSSIVCRHPAVPSVQHADCCSTAQVTVVSVRTCPGLSACIHVEGGLSVSRSWSSRSGQPLYTCVPANVTLGGPSEKLFNICALHC
jgi:hypothetical protein